MAPAKITTEKIKNEIIGIVLVALSVLCWAGLYVLDVGYISSTDSIGTVGQLLVRCLSALTGEGKYLFPFLLTAWGIRLINGNKEKVNNLKYRMVGCILLFITLLSTLHQSFLKVDNYKEVFKLGLEGQGGGLIGALGALILKAIFGELGTWIVLFTLTVIAILLITGISLTSFIGRFRQIISSSFTFLKKWLSDFLFMEIEEDVEKNKKKNKKRGKRKLRKQNDEEQVVSFEDSEQTEIATMSEQSESLVSVINKEEEFKQVQVYPENVTPMNSEDEKESEEQSKDSPQTEASITIKGRNNSTQENYILPPISLLNRSVRVKNPRLEKDITDRIKILEDTLENFGVKVKVTQVSCGPAITRYEVQPAPGVKVSRIVSLADDVALSLAASQVRIEAPIPGKAAVGIEVPNKEIAVVYLREVIESPSFTESSSRLTVGLGKDIAGNTVIADLAKMPHLLIAGSTGSGKSVCLNSLICSLLFKATPQELKLLMIDPKKVELTQYNGIPHLLAPVVSQPKKAATALQWMVNEMEKRYELFAGAGVKDITRYNQLKQKENEGEETLPLIVVLIDELADLMMVAPADVEDAICRLAQMARAAGIHLVVATQRPSVDVITGLIKANISSRIAFAVSSQIDSRTILDMGGAEKLLGRGDMLFLPIGANKPIRVQGVYVSDREVEDLVTYVKQQARPEYNPNFLKTEESSDNNMDADDELFPTALKVVLETGQASISMLQRRLRIGYTRAARLMDMMEARGFVGGHEGTKARTILTNWDEYNELFGSNEEP
ncbi:MAG: segregation ATPase FtsK/SpoIIIE, family [Clostridia bacterium]|nr:segregation ATPase FtsK/SpoIIIE, family [Clostridia bacterium]